ncbi:MAG: response regulator [Bacteroidota bacterium]
MTNEGCDILLIEDDPDDAELILRVLRKNIANKLLHLDDGGNALTHLFSLTEEKFPKLILLDLKMPRIDGIEVLKRLKQDDLRKNIPVIVMISSDGGKNYVESRNVSADAYILKPLNFEALIQATIKANLSWAVLSRPPMNV